MSQPPEKPRFEPEIIPPGQEPAQQGSDDPGWMHASGVHRVYVGRVGPFGLGMLALGIGLFAAATVLLILGVFLILIPVAGLLLAVAIISGLARAHFGGKD